MIRIAIDGPGGAGKSSVAKIVAKKLGIIYVDTGALYRAIGLYQLNHNINPKDHDGVIATLKDIKINLSFTDRQILTLNGEDVGDKIRTPEVSMAASDVSAIPEVRAFLLRTQRDIADKSSVIMDGRDIGTVILPQADLKVFLVASPEARAMRRFKELSAKGVETTYEAVYEEMVVRDTNDSTRATAPCVPAPDAFYLDNSDLTLEGTAEAILSLLDRKKKAVKDRKTYLRAHKLFAPLVRFFNRIHVTGKENIPTIGGVIVCSNHIAAKDVFLLASVFPRQLRYIAKKELFSIPFIGRLIRKAGAIRVERNGKDAGAVRAAVELAKCGEAIAIFPQGHRYPGISPALTQPKCGAAMIAFHANCPILPVCIKVKNVRYGLFRRVNILIGKPMSIKDLTLTEHSSDAYQKAIEEVYAEMMKLGGYSLPSSNASKS